MVATRMPLVKHLFRLDEAFDRFRSSCAPCSQCKRTKTGFMRRSGGHAQEGADMRLRRSLLTGGVAYHFAKFDHLVILAPVEHAQGHEQASVFALAILHVLPRDEHF